MYGARTVPMVDGRIGAEQRQNDADDLQELMCFVFCLAFSPLFSYGGICCSNMCKSM